MSHPAEYSPEIIAALRPILANWEYSGPGQWAGVYDPFAGVGVRLGALCDELGIPFFGGDIEEWEDSDYRVRLADATVPGDYPWFVDRSLIVTSPTYANGVNDHFNPTNPKGRLTYRISLGRPLHENNSGRYGLRGGKKAIAKYWEINRAAVKCWPDQAIVNVKNFVYSVNKMRRIYPLVRLWRELLAEHGYVEERLISVEVRGYRNGKNRENRVDHEALIIVRR